MHAKRGHQAWQDSASKFISGAAVSDFAGRRMSGRSIKNGRDAPKPMVPAAREDLSASKESLIEGWLTSQGLSDQYFEQLDRILQELEKESDQPESRKLRERFTGAVLPA